MLEKKSGAVLPVAHLIDCDDALLAALAHLREIDPDGIAHMHAVAGVPPLRQRAPGFEGLAAIIVSQQVSVASAASIFGRLERRFQPLSAAAIKAASTEDLRGCGLSAPKIRCLFALAAAVEEDGLDLAGLGSLSAARALATLTKVKGIGPWTADIFLLFCLGHPDAWPSGDLALQEGVRLALKLDKRPDARALEVLSERWRPYRGVAARLVWAYYGAMKTRRGFEAMPAGKA